MNTIGMSTSKGVPAVLSLAPKTGLPSPPITREPAERQAGDLQEQGERRHHEKITGKASRKWCARSPRRISTVCLRAWRVVA